MAKRETAGERLLRLDKLAQAVPCWRGRKPEVVWDRKCRLSHVAGGHIGGLALLDTFGDIDALELALTALAGDESEK